MHVGVMLRCWGLQALEVKERIGGDVGGASGNDNPMLFVSFLLSFFLLLQNGRGTGEPFRSPRAPAGGLARRGRWRCGEGSGGSAFPGCVFPSYSPSSCFVRRDCCTTSVLGDWFRGHTRRFFFCFHKARRGATQNLASDKSLYKSQLF